MSKRDLPFNLQCMLASLELQVAETVVDSEYPEVLASEMRASFPENDNVSFDIKVEYGLIDNLRQVGEEYAVNGYSGVIRREEGSDTGRLVVCSFIPILPSMTRELTKIEPKVYHCSPSSGADALILILANSQDEAEELIEAHIDADVDFLDIYVDEDYNGITGESRILEVVGFDCNCN